MQSSQMQASQQISRRAVVLRARPHQMRARRSLAVQALKVGDTLPAFEIITDTGSTLKSQVRRPCLVARRGRCVKVLPAYHAACVLPLQDMVKDSGCVIFVYPKAATSGCTTQVSHGSARCTIADPSCMHACMPPWSLWSIMQYGSSHQWFSLLLVRN